MQYLIFFNIIIYDKLFPKFQFHDIQCKNSFLDGYVQGVVISQIPNSYDVK